MVRVKARSQSQKIIQAQISEDERMRQQEKYRNEKIAYSTSTKGIREAKIRSILQQVTTFDNDAIMSILKDAQKITDNLYEFIYKELNLKNGTSVEEIEKIINECLPLLKKLKTLSENKEIRSKEIVNRYTMYERLFNKLIDADVKFVMFAPKKCIERSSIQNKIKSNPIIATEVEKLKITMKDNENADYVSTHIVCEFEPDNIRVDFANSLIKEIHNSEKLSSSKMVVATENLSYNIYNFIVTELELGEDSTRPSIQEIEDVISVSLYAIKRLKSLSYNEYLKTNEWNCTPYEKLFNNLMDIDIRFAMYAPIASLNRLDIDFKRLSEQEKEVVFKRIQKSGLWNNPEYVDVYHHVFAIQIAKTNELEMEIK